MAVIDLSDKDFAQEVLRSDQVALVDFWATWCGPCQMIAPALEKLDKEYNGKIKICKMNIDENRAVAAKYQVLSIPTLLFFKQGKVAVQLVGARPESEIKKVVDSLC